MRVFIVRPFGKKDGVDFDLVESKLIKPAMTAAKVSGGTTALIARSGNIRVDMFEQLVLADLVIADISVHNANVFYELGLRHALRDRPTILIRFSRPAAKKKGDPNPDEVPFDLKTDRYLEYNLKRLGASVPELTKAILDTRKSTNIDSPVYLLLPELRPPKTEKLRAVAEEFREAVIKAAAKNDFALLGLLAEEIDDVPWKQAARRLIGKTFFEKKSWAGARIWLEAVRKEDRDDVEANLLLGSVYQKLRDLPESNAALTRVLDSGEMKPEQRAEKLSLVGSNYKTLWIEQWQSLPSPDRSAAALRGFPQLAVDAYDEGFTEDQNHYYSGINSLSLRVLQLELIKALPHVWQERFDAVDEANAAQASLEKARVSLEGAVYRSIEAERKRQDARVKRGATQGIWDYWIYLGWADFRFLTAQKPEAVAQAYRDAIARDQGRPFSGDSAARQLRIFRDLGIFVAKAEAAIRALEQPLDQEREVPKRQRVVLFSGHRIDRPGRRTRRFPASREAAATVAIREKVLREKKAADGAPIKGIAGAANGGDIIFHEVCRAEGIPTEVMLALPEKEYAEESVSDAGAEWTERFRRLVRATPPKILGDSKELPSWVAGRKNYKFWNRNNLWTLNAALAHIHTDVTLIALFDGKKIDEPGGTYDMVERARDAHVNVIRIDPAKLAGS